jgi:2-phospho-L-lactate guanylyltransferase
MSTGWVLLLPLKRLRHAKTRLSVPMPAGRERLVRAMAETVAATAAQAPPVHEVVVVTAETWDHHAVPVHVFPDGGGGLNRALSEAARTAGRRWPQLGLATLLADAAAGTAEELTRCLDAARHHPRTIVADHLGTGTVLLTAGPGVPMAPRFGPGSRRAHVRSGAVDLTDRLRVPLMRRDLDTPGDLAAVADRLRALPELDRALRHSGWTGTRFRAVAGSAPA